ncbi:MAG TPA: efflux RND transporter permease subunit [Thermoanaerobaculia bacterium]|nr:efflux RND transporter permease subunit [Thermoanaerobaculia bacterium]
MKFTDIFIRRPVLATVVNLVILIAGLQSIRSLSVRQFPRSDLANVKISTAYIGANADVVRGFITSPLERVIASADGIDFIESSSGQSVSTITVHLKLNYDTNAALTQIQSKVAQVRNDLPPGFTVDYAGESRQLRIEGSKFLGTFLLSAILIYLVLAAQFESFRDPFIILAGSVPLALSGALLFSFLGLTSLNIYSQVGLITLVGLVSRNGILITEFANHLQETGKDKLSAVIEAAGTRLRPVLMTTAATVVGHMPLVFASGPGAGARNSIGIMLVSGMIIGTMFTLLVVPSIYVLVARTRTQAGTAEESGPAGELAPART